VKIEELRDERWVVATRCTGCREGVTGACRTAGFDPQMAIESDENTQTMAFVATGLGVAMLPRLGLSAMHPGVAVKPLAGAGLTRRVWAATVAGAYRSPATEAMIEILREVAVEYEERAPLAVA
jgi:DNA-binding transcriptional LysR family regulator